MTHRERAERIAAELRRRAGASERVVLGKSAVSHMVPNPHDPRHQDARVDVRDLNQLVELDVPGRRCVAESGLTFSDLVRQTLPHGLIPKVVPELKTVTIGGAVAGGSVESMSHKYGGFHDSCLSYEVITGRGEILRCSREQDPELFEMVHGSYGTFAIISLLEFELIPAKPYVRMEYEQHDSLESFHRALVAHCQARDADFVDAIVHSRNQFVICLGRFVDSAPYTSDYTFLNIYYKSTLAKREDYLTTYDYLFRYDAECHWMWRAYPGMEGKLLRLLLGKLVLGSTKMLTWAKRLRPILKHRKHPEVVVDVFIPNVRFPDFYRWYAEKLDYYPLWIVPYVMDKPYAWLEPSFAKAMGDPLFMDCAIYGMRNDRPGVNFYRELEHKTHALYGFKTLISENHYTPESFWTVYDRERCENMKRAHDPGGVFRGFFEKFNFGRGQG